MSPPLQGPLVALSDHEERTALRPPDLGEHDRLVPDWLDSDEPTFPTLLRSAR